MNKDKTTEDTEEQNLSHDQLFRFPESDNAVAQIKRSLEKYAKNHCDTESLPIDLMEAYKFLKENINERNKLWTALIDFLLSYLHLFRSIIGFSINWSDEIVGGEDGLLDRLDIHYDLSNFVLRYRAVWDKFMGVYILLFAPDKYKGFWKAKSKRKYFLKFLQNDPSKEELASYMKKVFEKFEKEFRTGEIHGSGRIRLWSFLPVDKIGQQGSENIKENKVFQVVSYWNILNDAIHILGHCLAGEESCSCRKDKETVKVTAISKKNPKTVEVDHKDFVAVKNFFD